MRKGLPAVLLLCLVGPAPVAAQSVTLPSPRSILRDQGDTPRVDADALPMLPPPNGKPDQGVRQVSAQGKEPPSLFMPPTPKATPEIKETVPALPAPLAEAFRIPEGASPCFFWTRLDYLLWNVTRAPLPPALVTKGDPFDFLPGALNQAGTQVLLGGGQNIAPMSGLRLTMGVWLNHERNVGLEASGFFLQRRSTTFVASSNSSGSPLLALAFVDQTPGLEGPSALQVSNPSPFTGLPLTGTVQVQSNFQLWGAEANGLFCLWAKPGFEWLLLTGFRYADLRESLTIANATTDTSTTPNTTWILHDNFETRNQFYGGQLGTRLNFQWDRLSLNLTGKLAMGGTHQVVNIQGGLNQAGPTALTLPYGFYTEPSNVGYRSLNQFTVLPSAEARIGYQLTNHLRASVGYDFLFWNQVVRPGNQIDPNINRTQNAASFGAGGVASGPAYPIPEFNRSSLWVYGVSFGLEWTY